MKMTIYIMQVLENGELKNDLVYTSVSQLLNGLYNYRNVYENETIEVYEHTGDISDEELIEISETNTCDTSSYVNHIIYMEEN